MSNKIEKIEENEMSLHDYALHLLQKHGCKEDCYYDTPIDTVIGDLKQAYPYGMPFFYRDVAEELIKIGNAIPHFPKETVALCEGDATKYGLTDLYPEAEQKLRELLDSGKPFRTRWASCAKESVGFQISSNGVTEVIVDADDDEIDEGIELVDDAIWSLGIDDGFFSIKEMEEIYEIVTEDPQYTFSTANCMDTLPYPATYEQIMDTLEKLGQQNRETLDEAYEFLKEIVKQFAIAKGWKFEKEGEDNE